MPLLSCGSEFYCLRCLVVDCGLSTHGMVNFQNEALYGKWSNKFPSLVFFKAGS